MSPYLWFYVMVVMGIAEAITAGLITAWFVIGAIAAYVCSLAGASEIVQVGVFLVVSLLTLVAFRPLALKYRNKGASKEPDVVGREAVVVEILSEGSSKGSYRVKLSNGVSWPAECVGCEALQIGDRVIVLSRNSITLQVERNS